MDQRKRLKLLLPPIPPPSQDTSPRKLEGTLLTEITMLETEEQMMDTIHDYIRKEYNTIAKLSPRVWDPTIDRKKRFEFISRTRAVSLAEDTTNLQNQTLSPTNVRKKFVNRPIVINAKTLRRRPTSTLAGRPEDPESIIRDINKENCLHIDPIIGRELRNSRSLNLKKIVEHSRKRNHKMGRKNKDDLIQDIKPKKDISFLLDLYKGKSTSKTSEFIQNFNSNFKQQKVDLVFRRNKRLDPMVKQHITCLLYTSPSPRDS
eukprot:TRINITY_DN4711_c0_g1_i1.p1 TRINITY_DN4711_c0_g1~~TRINITY_DN4711_c0_g1_i1.p1  ORF type:complete len:261 (+),score=41.60 TRINITY_DN4711_c0_g1_i1:64-846(+)